MNGIIALCHFCEEHSASIVLCTLPINPSKSESHPLNSKSQHKNVNWKPHNNPDYLFNQLLIYHSILGIYNSETSEPVTPPQSCRACSLILEDEAGLISHDTAQEVTYTSINYPLNASVYQILLKAGVQSLAEMSSDSGPSYFCDESRRMHVFSYPFYLKDLEARGGKSRFSILVISPDELFLFNIWPFLDLNVGLIVKRLQTAANNVFDKESRQLLSLSDSTGRASSAQRIHQRTFTPPPSGAGMYASKPEVGSFSADARTRRKKRLHEARSIMDLTKIDQLFYRIHAWFTWILRAANQRWIMAVRAIPPPVLEDARVLSEQMVDGDLSPNIEAQPNESYHVLGQLLVSLGLTTFSRLVQHLVIGNQIVIDSSEAQIGELMLAALSALVPRGCAKHAAAESECLLVLLKSKSPQLPLGCQPGCLLRIKCPPRDARKKHAFDGLVDVYDMIDRSEFFVFYAAPISDPVFHRTSQGELYETASDALSSNDMTTDLFSNFLPTPPSEMEISNLVHRYCDLLNTKPPLEAGLLHCALLNLKEEWLSKARLVYSFEKCQSHFLKTADYRRRLNTLLEAINLNPGPDEAVIKFFQHGLSHYSLKNPCHANKSRSSFNSRRASLNSSGSNSFIGDSATTLASTAFQNLYTTYPD